MGMMKNLQEMVNLKNVEEMNSMFADCSSLENIGLKNINAQSLTTMDSMFNG